MKAKCYLCGFAVAAVLGVILFISGCAQPPTEKVNALQSDFRTCETRGASIFAQSDYEKISKKMAELQNLMDQKKYRKATALADSITADMDALKAAVEKKGRETAQQIAASLSDELGKLKALLVPENISLLGSEVSQNYQQLCSDYESKVNQVQDNLNNEAFVDVYNNSSLVQQIAASEKDINAALEQAKALAAQKAAAKTGKKR
ncbi:MAG TPA: hypothetical protein VM123_18430 [archaeon]|nr:hypothetical protein [archaeon]